MWDASMRAVPAKDARFLEQCAANVPSVMKRPGRIDRRQLGPFPGANATAASLVSKRNVMVSCKYKRTTISLWLE